MAEIDIKFDRNKFLINPHRLSHKRKYYIYDEDEEELFYVERPFKFFRRKNILVFGDDSKGELVLTISQEHLWEVFHRNYTVYDAHDQEIGRLSLNNSTTLFRRGWNITNPTGELIAKVKEDSVATSVIGLGTAFIPLIPPFGAKTNFHFWAPDGSNVPSRIGAFSKKFNRKFSMFDRYVLDLSEDPDGRLDRRVALATGILLDAN